MGGSRIRSGPACWAGKTASRPAPVRRRPGPSALPAGGQPAAEFLQSLHVLVQSNAAAVENWPRVGLEAMAAGVPLVVDAKGGWLEMLRHGRTGYLCRTDDELAYYAARLAYDEGHRLRLVARARAALVAELADPHVLWPQWQELFESLERSNLGTVQFDAKRGAQNGTVPQAMGAS